VEILLSGLERLVLSDIEAGEGLALVDPHGDLAERIAARIPAHRKDDLIYLNVPDRSQPFGYNPLKRVTPERRPLAGSGLLEVFEKMWPEAWGVRMERILRNALLALLDQPQASLPDVLKLLLDKGFRKAALRHIDNRQVRAFWENEYEKYSDRMRADGIAPIQNKVGAFLADPTLYRILTNPERPINIRRIMDEGKILLVNLAKGQIGEDASSLLGGLLVTTIGLAAFSRQETDAAARRPFYCYLDEFQNFTTLSMANMFSELRKYRVGMIVVHQYLYQLEERNDDDELVSYQKYDITEPAYTSLVPLPVDNTALQIDLTVDLQLYYRRHDDNPRWFEPCAALGNVLAPAPCGRRLKRV
jgi:hypothetical protein